MQTADSKDVGPEVKKTWARPDFEFHSTGMEVTAYSGRS